MRFRFGLRSLLMLLLVSGACLAFFDFESFWNGPIREVAYPSESVLSDVLAHQGKEYHRQLAKLNVFYGVRDARHPGEQHKLAYVVFADQQSGLSEQQLRQRATRFPRRQLHQFYDGRHTTLPQRVPVSDLVELLVMRPDQLSIHTLVQYSQRRSEWKKLGLDLTTFWGPSGYDQHREICQAAFQHDRAIVLRWLCDFPNRSVASQCFNAGLQHKVPWQKATWILERLPNTPEFQRAFLELGVTYFDHDSLRPPLGLLQWANSLKNANQKTAALSGIVNEWLLSGDGRMMPYLIRNVQPHELAPIDKLWEAAAPAADLHLALPWWRARAEYLKEADPMWNAKLQASFACTPNDVAIESALKLTDLDLRCIALRAIFANWQDPQQIPLMLRVWNASPEKIRHATLKTVAVTVLHMNPGLAELWTQEIKDDHLRAMAIAQVARLRQLPITHGRMD